MTLQTILLQAMMAVPFVLVMTFLPITIIVYSTLRLADRVRGERNTADEKWLVKRRSVHLLIALLAGVLACAYFIYIWSHHGAGRFT